jgi:hypothetical protein
MIAINKAEAASNNVDSFHQVQSLFALEASAAEVPESSLLRGVIAVELTALWFPSGSSSWRCSLPGSRSGGNRLLIAILSDGAENRSASVFNHRASPLEIGGVIVSLIVFWACTLERSQQEGATLRGIYSMPITRLSLQTCQVMHLSERDAEQPA